MRDMYSAYEHSGDLELMRSLGLRTDDYAHGEFVDLGTVVVREADEYGPASTVRVEVCALPAQFYRFTVTRPSMDEGDEVVFEVGTGTGGFGEFWPIAYAVADDMISVKRIS